MGKGRAGKESGREKRKERKIAEEREEGRTAIDGKRIRIKIVKPQKIKASHLY